MTKITPKMICNVLREFQDEDVQIRTKEIEADHHIFIISSDMIGQNEIIRRVKKILRGYQIDRWNSGTIIAGKTN